MKKTLIATANGDRLDVYVSNNSDISRSYIGKLIENKLVYVNGEIATKKGIILKNDDVIDIEIPEEVDDVIEKKDIPIDIIYQDDDLAVINKPQGLTVHPSLGNTTDTLVNGLMYHLDSLSAINGVVRPGIVHRLDKDTSGVMVVAKNDKSHIALSQQISDRQVEKYYLALLEGNVKNDKGLIKTKIGRNPKDRKQMAVTYDGREALTEYKVLERFEKNCFVLFNLLTGRTHQIRVHAKHIRNPVVGDPVYGYKKQRFELEGQLLHSYKLVFTHPTTGKRMEFYAPLPEYFAEVYKNLAYQENKEVEWQKIVDKMC